MTNARSKVVATYDYVDENGDKLFQVRRREPKSFTQHAWTGEGWGKNLGGARKVLYRLPQVIAAVAFGGLVIKPEGEKDVHTLEELGEVATCNPGGAGPGKWLPEYSEDLRGADVMIIADNDPETKTDDSGKTTVHFRGQLHALEVYDSLEGVAASREIRRAKSGKDVTDHLEAGHSLDDLILVNPADLRKRAAELKAQHQPTTSATSAQTGAEVPRGLLTVLGALAAEGCGPTKAPSDPTKDYDVRCPLHGDKSPSATVCVGTDRPVVFHCHTGCGNDEFFKWLTDAGVSTTELMDGKPPNSGGESWEPVDITEILGEGYEPDLPTIGRRDDGVSLIYPGKTHSVAGEPEAAKSLLCQFIASQELAAGNHVVYIDYEDTAHSVVKRLLDLGVTPERIQDRFHYLRPDEPFAAGVGRVEAMVRQHEPTLFVLDGVTEAMTVEGMSPMDLVEVAVFLKSVARRIVDMSGAAYLQIDHVTKAKEGRAQFAIGSQHKLAGLDGAAYTMEKVTPFIRGHGGRSKIVVAKDRPGWVKPYTVGGKLAGHLEMFADPKVPGRFVTKITSPTQEDREAELDPGRDLEERIVRELMADMPPSEMTKTKVQKRVGGRAEAFRTVWDRLVDEGGIVSEKLDVPNARGEVRKTEVWGLA